MPPPLPTAHRGMTANPVRPGRYRPGKPVTEEPSSEEEESDDEEANKAAEQERRRQAEAQRRQEHLQQLKKKQQPPTASSFPGEKITKGVRDVKIDGKEVESEDEDEGFVTEDEEDEKPRPAKVAPPSAKVEAVPTITPTVGGEGDEEEEESEEESSEEESSSEEEAPRRVLLRPTFIKKDKRNNVPAQRPEDQGDGASGAAADTSSRSETQEAKRREKADLMIRDQLEKDAIARSTANKAWDDDEMMEAGEEGAIDDTDGLDADAEYAAWKLRELKRVKRAREIIEASEKEREEVERRRNLTAEEREREDREFISKQKEERDAARGQTGYMKRYFHKGAFFHDDLAKEGLDQRNVMGSRFVDDVSRETLPQYMQVRDLTKIGKKGRTRYKDLRSEDTGHFGQDLNRRPGGRRAGPPGDVTDERFLPDRPDDKPSGPTGANASAVGDRYRAQGRKRSPSPYEDRDKRRRTESVA